MKVSDRQRFYTALLFAVLLHLVLLLPFLQWALNLQPGRYNDERLEIDLAHQDEQWLKEREKKKTPEEQLEEYQPKEEIPKGQVVEAKPSKDKRRPEKSRFLSEEDSRVDKETKAPPGRPGEGQFVTVTGEQQQGKDLKTAEGGMKAEAEEQTVLPLPPNLEKGEEGQAVGESSIEVPQAPRSLRDINLQPSMHAMSSALAGSGLDHIEGVIEGDETALNTKGWRYASFFNRVKRDVARFWHPDVEYQRHDPYGNIYGLRDRITTLLVVLRRDGGLKEAYVMNPSGATFLDDEAREAVEQAAPFSNVPDGLIDGRDGLVKFTFHFLVEVGEEPVFRIRRYP